MEHVGRMGREEVYTGFWWRNMVVKDNLEEPNIDGRINIKIDLQEVECGAGAGSSWLRLETGGGHL